jgi:Mg-chelatase subunit ChlD
MWNYATYETSDGKETNDGFTILNIVQHAINAVMNMLEDDDRVALVVFAEHAKVVFPLTNMTEISKIKCKEELFALKPYGPTNIWEGLYEAMETLREGSTGVEFGNVERRKAVMLLTDGVPNREP